MSQWSIIQSPYSVRVRFPRPVLVRLVCWFGTTKKQRVYMLDMPRPNINDSTIEAVTLLANQVTEFEADRFDIDTRTRMALFAMVSSDVEVDWGTKRSVQSSIKPFDI